MQAEYIAAHVHQNRVAALVHLRCNDSFSTRTDQVKALGHDLCMQIVASCPYVVAPEDMEPQILESLLEPHLKHLARLEPQERLTELARFRARIQRDYCLLSQAFIKDPNVTVAQHIDAVSAELSESIVVVRFVRYETNLG